MLEYRTLKRKVHNHPGYLGEVFMSQVLWNSQRRTLPGDLFHSGEDIEVPSRWVYIWHPHPPGGRPRHGNGRGSRRRRADVDLRKQMVAGEEKPASKKWNRCCTRGRMLKENKGPGLEIVRLWFFAHDGFTQEAEAMMKENGVLWSGREDLNGLLSVAGLKRLPEV